MRVSTCSIAAFALAAPAVALTARTSQPFEITWTGDGSQPSWQTASQWDSGHVPLPCASVTIDGNVVVEDSTTESIVEVDVVPGGMITIEPGGEVQVKGSDLTDFASCCNAQDMPHTNTGTHCVPNTEYPTGYPTAYPTAAPTDAPTSHWQHTGSRDSYEACPRGFFFAPPTQEMTDHMASIDYFMPYKHLMSQTKYCQKCPRGTTSGGGYVETCHTIVDTWTVCSHVACQISNKRGCGNAHHRSENPAAQLAAADSIPTIFEPGVSCHVDDATTDPFTHAITGRDRVVVYHHGHEAKGTMHKCQVENPSNPAGRGQCVCMCKDDHVKAHALHPDSDKSDEASHQNAEADYRLPHDLDQLNIGLDQNL